MYFVDANVFLRVLVKENQRFFNESVAFLSLIKKGRIKALTSCVVLAEVAWTLSSFYKFPKEKVIKGLKSIVNLKGLKIRDKSNISLAIDLFDNFNVKFIDTLIASDTWLRDGTATIVSYDRDFDKIGVRRAEPSQVVRKKRP